MNQPLSFTNTCHDAVDAYEAQRVAGGGLRSWARGALAGLGLLWVAGFVVLIQQPEWSWRPFASLGAGVFVLWTSVLHPLLVRRRIRRDNASAQHVLLMCSDSGLSVRAQDQEEFTLPWDALIDLVAVKKGLLLRFSGGAAHWIPARAFQDRRMREQFVQFVERKLAMRGRR